MATVSKTLTWQSTVGSVDYYEIGIASTLSGTPTVIKTTSDATTTTVVEYDSSVYPTAWLFVRAIATNGDVSEWSDPVSAESLTPTFTPPQPLQYAYYWDVEDQLAGMTIPSALTERIINKACLEASRTIDSLVGKRFSNQTVVERYDGNGTSELSLDHYPIIKINYVKVNSGSGLEIIREYSDSDLELSDYEAGILTLKPITLDVIDDASWQSVSSLLYGHVFAVGKSNIEVSYKYGYLEYAEGEELDYISSSVNSSTSVTSRLYRGIHHNWSSNNMSIYRNGSLMLSDYSVDTKTGEVTISGGADDDTITANYYHTIPHDVEAACAKLAAATIASQVAASSTGGVTQFRNMNYQETYGSRPFNYVIDDLKKEADRIIKKYVSIDMYAV